MTVAASLGGVALGGVIGAFSGWGLELSRRRHAEARRWDSDRLRLYASYLTTAETVERIADDWIRQEKFKSPSPETRDEFHAWEEQVYKLAVLIQEIDLLATPSVRRAVRSLWEALVAFGNFSHYHGWGDSDTIGELKSAVDRHIGAKAEFKDAVRQELGLPGFLEPTPRLDLN